MHRFKVRHLLYALFGIMALITLAAVAWGGRAALFEFNISRFLLLGNELSDLTLKVNTSAAMERGLTSAMLAQSSVADDDMRAEMEQLRRENEVQVDAALEAAQGLSVRMATPALRGALAVMRQRHQELVQARHAADLWLERGEGGGELDFHNAITAFIEAVAAVRHAAQATVMGDELVQGGNLMFKEALYTASEYFGRERAMWGVAIAQGRPLTPSERDTLLGLRSMSGLAFNKLQLAVSHLGGNSAVAAAREVMNEEFSARYQALREAVFAASEQGVPYPVDAQAWYQEATRGIGAIIQLGSVVNHTLAQTVEQRMRRAAIRLLLFALSALLVVTALLTTAWLIHRRVVAPLKSLEQAAEAIGAGDYAQTLQLQGGDELAELGDAFDKMRRGLLEQMAARDQAETQLQASARRFRNLVESTNDWLWEVDEAGRYTYVSPQVEAILGYAPHEVLGRSPFELMPPEEAARLEPLLAERVARREPLRAVENVNRHKDGRLVVLETNGVPVVDESGGFSGYRGIDRDITERRHAEQAQHESERRFHDLLENMQLLAVMLDEAGNITFVNRHLLQSTGWTREEVVGHGWIEWFVPAELHATLQETYMEAMTRDQPILPHEYAILTRDAGLLDIAWNSIVIHDADGRVVGCASVGSDVTEQRRSEAEMQKLLRVVEQTDDAVVITDPVGIIEYVNPAFERVTGYSRDEVVGEHSRLLSSGIQGEEFYRRLWQTISAGRPFQALMTNRRKNGELFHEEKTITPLRAAAGAITHYVATSKDVTERRRMDEQLQQSEKLASIGQLAAGVAHEINNPVGYISSNITTLARYLEEIFQLLDGYERAEAALCDPAVTEELQALKAKIDLAYLRTDVRDLIDESGEGINRVKKIVQDLKDFSRQEEAEWQMTDLHKGLESTLNIVHNELKYKAEVVREFGDLPPVECIPSQLNQVFMNLLVNAAHAIEQYGVVTVRTGTEREWAWVEVEDNGKGIAPEHLNRLFEPFFTTEPVGKGTGLGLSISYGIVQKHGGRIEVDSEVGKGTKFRVWLPLRQESVEGASDGQ